MKTFKSITILFISCLILSCSSEDNISDERKLDLSNIDLTLLGKSQINLIDNYHSKTYSKNSNNEIEGFDKNVMGSFLENQLSELSIHDFDLRYSNNDLSALSNTFLSDLMIAIDDFDSAENFNLEINNLKIKVSNSNISAYEKKVVLGTIEVTKESTIYYAPKELGGKSAKGTIKQYHAKGWSWKRAAKGAAAGSMTFFLGIGLTIVAPPAGLAILSAWAWSAAAGAVIGGSGVINDL